MRQSYNHKDGYLINSFFLWPDLFNNCDQFNQMPISITCFDSSTNLCGLVSNQEHVLKVWFINTTIKFLLTSYYYNDDDL